MLRTTGSTGCNCDMIRFCPHASGTHMETEAHIQQEGRKPLSYLKDIPPLMLAFVLDGIDLASFHSQAEAIIIRTGAFLSLRESNSYDFTGTNPPYLSPDNISSLGKRFLSAKFILIDAPSMDPESDGGQLLAHKAFFSLFPNATGIIELCNIPEGIHGLYALSLNPAAFDSDATPCAPILYPLMPCTQEVQPQSTTMSESCIFCKIIKGAIPCHKILETPTVLAFLDINPLASGHTLIIPKHHGAKLHDIPEDHLVDILSVAKKIAQAIGCPDYNILQNNGRLAHQEVDHVHFHLIPKPNETEGLGIRWPSQATDHGKFAQLAESIRAKLSN